jgi:hypothetical protein
MAESFCELPAGAVMGVNNPGTPIDYDRLAEAIGRAITHVFTWKNAFSAALLAASEYAMLSLIEDAPRSIKLATLIAPTLAFLAIQFESRIRKLGHDLYPIILALLAGGYVAFGAYVYFETPYSTPNIATPSTPAPAPAATSDLSAFQIAKFLTPMQAQITTLEQQLAAAQRDNPRVIRERQRDSIAEQNKRLPSAEGERLSAALLEMGDALNEAHTVLDTANQMLS